MKRFLIFALLLLALAACTPVPTATPTTPPTPTVELTVDPPTITPSATAEPTMLPPTATTEPTALPPTATLPVSPPATPTAPISPLPTPQLVQSTPILLPQSGAPVDEFPEQMYTVEGFLILLAGGGLSYLIGAALSYLFVEVKWFQKLTAGQKRALSIAASIALPLLAQTLLMTVPRELLASFDPLWAVLISSVAGLVGNKQTYRGTIKPQEREWIIEE